MGKAGLYIKQRTVYCRPNRGNRLAGVRAHVCWRPAVVAGRAAHVPSCSCPEPGRIPAWPTAKQANDALPAALAIRKRIRFLDVASGAGYLAAAAAARGANVLGIDFAAAMVELATRLNPGCGRQHNIDPHADIGLTSLPIGKRFQQQRFTTRSGGPAEFQHAGQTDAGDINLSPYRQGVQDLDDTGLHLQQAVTSDEKSIEPVRRIEHAKTAKVTELARSIELARSGNRAAAIALVQTNEGKRYMDSLRSDLGQLLNDWREKRRSRLAMRTSGWCTAQLRWRLLPFWCVVCWSTHSSSSGARLQKFMRIPGSTGRPRTTR
ncbi:CHASE3 domain-containing protein [Paraburkholderia sediminicola]|uniref:CHASE3 domain-containing protein n=1 Tax=Paraburkholderia sediminicola TaxID=458836 RepID=UPI0038BAC739